jgi:ABC-2 type transport system ATP-binding protein
MVIGQGRILSDGTLAELRAKVTRERWLSIDLAEGCGAVEEPGTTVIRREGQRLCLAFDPQVIAPAELIQRVASRYEIRDLFVENPPIETIIARLYESTHAEHAAQQVIA